MFYTVKITLNRLARHRSNAHDRICLTPKRIEEVLRDTILPIRRNIRKPHILFGIVEVVRTGLCGAQRFAALAIPTPKEAAAGIGVRDGRPVKIRCRAQPVLLIVGGTFVGYQRFVRRQPL